ncbi:MULTISPECIES: phytoene desaturase family protein [Paraburkholderia]|uniref:Pyridine nucleotide-disulfide oxidoreductase domain-containing protein 2 n=1 Tax=Paraburkholderia podalyriae TaxID=1938811 RepID=A0ABR7PZG7_9BURK|nr:NAD(P)/FAD-dependent oxidoreductase [Paraburkholderia podalyriae]MBC8751681.1 NAD(P)/FAD-dependent oxidoreductase [Paraburkholderia podalyriae]
MADFDVVIVGGGHNGLVCSAYLAEAGLKVSVLERRPVIGGAAVTEELWPGFHLSVASYWMSLLQPKIMLDLELRRYGVKVLETAPGFQPFSNGTSIVFWPETKRMCEELAKFSPADAEAYPRYVAHMEALVVELRKLLFEIPVDPTTGKASDILKALSFAWRFRKIGVRFYDLWDLLTLSAYDYLKRWFSSPEVLTIFGCYASGSGGNIGPKSPGSAYVLSRPFLRDPNTAAGPGGLVEGGMGSITQALKRCAVDRGVVVRENAEVERVIVENGTAKGVRLVGGETVKARAVVSNTASKVLFHRLLDRNVVPDEVYDAVNRIRTDSSCFKINLATKALPQWTALQQRGISTPPGSITIAENLEELQRAFEAAGHGEMAQRPYMWILTPSAVDRSAAPEGMHTVSILGGHVPYRLKEGTWDDAAHDRLFDIVMSQIERYAPGFRENVLHRQVLAPPDIERIFALPGGHVHHGELSLDQVFFRRPIAHYADYRTPIKNLFQCGASTHPGGGVTGVPGHNAAKIIVAAMK